MFGGLKKTSSRIAIVAALGMTFGGYALSTPANAQYAGGDCCADLEERVAELEATTVRKGNKKVSVTISGWVIKAGNWWDDGEQSSFVVADKSYDLGSRFAITGSASIAPGWSAGYNLTVNPMGSQFGVAGTQAASNQFAETGNTIQTILTLYSYMYVKSDTYGTLNWGQLSPASDNAAVLADISGTVIETNAVFFEGASFFMRPNGAAGTGFGGLSGLTWQAFYQCIGLTGTVGIGADCFGAAQPAIRYDSPTFGGFRLETSYGTNDLTDNLAGALGSAGPIASQDANFWDIAVFYNDDWGNFKISAAYSYTWFETVVSAAGRLASGPATAPAVAFRGGEGNLHQVGATLMHAPSGIGVYGYYQNERTSARRIHALTGVSQGIPSTDAWYVKPFIKRTWNPLGATIFFGEYAQYNDQFASLVGTNLCGAFAGLGGTNAGAFCGANLAGGLFATGSEMERWGLGVVQEVDAAAMHIFARWQNQQADIDFVGINNVGGTQSVGQGFEDWNLFQVGGIIFF